MENEKQQEIFDKMKDRHANLSKKVATEGMVLLKNDNAVLPLKSGAKVAIFGKGQVDFVKGGDGSAEVHSAYTKNLLDGMLEKEREKKVLLAKPLLDLYLENSKLILNDEMIKTASEDASIAIITITRTSSEGLDRASEKGDFYLSDQETDMISRINNSKFEDIIIIFNIGAVIDTKWVFEYPKIKAVLLAWLPGMEGGAAVADILCGDVNPSGKLTDTFADSYDAYPSSKTFNRDEIKVYYEEDIFVGYRYFETIPNACDRVVFPFGFGLSYTTFNLSSITYSDDGVTATVGITVENTGKVSGKEVVQVYYNAPDGKLGKPKVQLIAYKKTKLLEPSEKQNLEISFKISNMSSFDDTGITDYQFAFVMEKGNYNILVGNSVRNLENIFTYNNKELAVIEQFKARWKSELNTRLKFDGTMEDYKATNVVDTNEEILENTVNDIERINKNIMLFDVASGVNTLDEFISQLTNEELINLSQAQPPSFPRGTAGVGNIKKYGIPNPQTADGPAGLRKTVPTTAFPCAALIGCTWDEDLQYEMGKSVGYEGVMTGVDIWLAPGLNIHRDPLCGRNFEYFSEDPLISGKSAASIIRGAQSVGIISTCKHFALNNKEYNRLFSDSIVSERALREVYLKGFEIVVRESQPDCIMSSYNLINGIRASTNYNLLVGILRDEWGFKGAVMTDWRNVSHLWEEIKAGNNIKMPFGYPDEIELAIEMVKCGKLTREELEKSVKNVLKLIMKTSRFKNQDFGVEHTILKENTTRIKAIEITGTSYTFTGSEPCLDDDGGINLSCLNKDQRGNDTFLIYNLDIEKAGEYILTARIATQYHEPFLEFQIDDKIIATIHQEKFEDSLDESLWQKWKTLEPTNVSLPEGDHILKVYIRTQDEKQKISLNWIEFKSI